MTDASVVVTGVVKRFGSHTAIEGLSLRIASREAVVVLGPSGCGKTTLLRLIAGLEVPDAGDIWIDGRHVSQAGRVVTPPNERRIGFVFQDLALWPHLTIRRHLEFVLDAVGVPRSKQPAVITEVTALVRIDHLAARYPHELSGGEQQRLALARALAGNPKLMLLDEPLSSLDPELRNELRGELRRLQSAAGLTMVYVTHDREDARTLGDRVIAMRNGQIIATTEDTRS